MLVRICCLLLLLTLTCCQFQTISCLSLTHVTLQQSSSMIASSAGYTFPVTWASTIPDITSGGLALGGFKVQQSLSYPSYTATLNSITTTGANILFRPLQSNTLTVLIQFEVMVSRSSCSDRLQVVTQSFAPSVLNSDSRSDSTQTFTVSASSFTITNTAQFHIETYFQDFIVQVPSNSRFMIRIFETTVFSGNIDVQVQSFSSYSNKITNLTLTALVLRPASFTSDPHYRGSTSLNAWGRNSFYSRNWISSQISPTSINAQWCSTSLNLVMTYSSLTDSPKGVVVTYDGFQGQFTTNNLWFAFFSISCMLECDPMYDLNNGAVYECYLCRQKIPGCYICASPTVCTTTCDSITPFCSDCDKSGTCLACSGGFVVSSNTCVCQTSAICLSCVNSSACSQCASGYYLSGVYCEQCPLGCSSCDSVSNCTQCSSGFYLTNQGLGSIMCSTCPTGCSDCLSDSNCSNCNPGYYLYPDFNHNTCLQCPDGCNTCASSTHCVSCMDGYQLQGNMCQASTEQDHTTLVIGIVFGSIFCIMIVGLLWVICCKYKQPAVIHDQESVSVHHMHQSQAEESMNDKGSVYFSQVAGASCSICLFDEMNCRTRCGHSFHVNCLKSWVRKGKNCPLCRSTRYNPVKITCPRCQTVQVKKELHKVVRSDGQVCPKCR